MLKIVVFAGATFFVDGGMTSYPSFGTDEEHDIHKQGTSINHWLLAF